MGNRTNFTDEQKASVESEWMNAWGIALADWSPFVQLHTPTWCWTPKEEQRSGLTGSFAMIRLVDHSIVLGMQQIVELGLQDYGVEILAHEIGHHVYCPSDLTDNARMLVRMRRGLPGLEPYAPMISNLYSDLLINDRLQRWQGRRMSDCYQILSKTPTTSDLWRFYMRIYEILWDLPKHSLTLAKTDPKMDQDAVLGTRLIRSYARDWLDGAGRFACLCLPYVAKDEERAREAFKLLGDALLAGTGGCPEGLAEVDDEEELGAIHPAEDPILAGTASVPNNDGKLPEQNSRSSKNNSGIKSIKTYRSPFEYNEIMQASGTLLDEREIAVRYYRERAIPHLIPFPKLPAPSSTSPIPEGLEVWDVGSDIQKIDWMESLLASPSVIPGVTTRERLTSEAPDASPSNNPVHLYLGVDCSGSMGDPARQVSFPVLAGAVIALSALRAGAKVKVVLSGEPGKSMSTDGFVRNPSIVLRTLVNYLGTGYSFGIHRLRETFRTNDHSLPATHILIVSDYDMFQMLNESGDGVEGWDIAREAAKLCGGGATFVLQLPGFLEDRQSQFQPQLDRMKRDGWDVHLVNSMEELVLFSRNFAKAQYQRTN